MSNVLSWNKYFLKVGGMLTLNQNKLIDIGMPDERKYKMYNDFIQKIVKSR